MARAVASSQPSLVLKLLIVLIDAADALRRWFYTTWYRLTVGLGPAKSGGSNPAPPAVIGIIIAEPNADEISLQTVANIATWCLSYESVQQLHLYEPSGHLKKSHTLLQQSLLQLAELQGKTIAVKCGWAGSNATLLSQQHMAHKPAATHHCQQQKHPQQSVLRAPQQVQTTSTFSLQQHEYQQQLRLESVGSAGVQHSLTLCGTQCLKHCKHTTAGSASSDHPLQQQQTSMQPSVDSVASPCSKQSAMSSSRNQAVDSGQHRNGRPTAVSLRLLSAEDAYLPVIDAAARRCSICSMPGSPPTAQEQLQQQAMNSSSCCQLQPCQACKQLQQQGCGSRSCCLELSCSGIHAAAEQHDLANHKQRQQQHQFEQNSQLASSKANEFAEQPKQHLSHHQYQHQQQQHTMLALAERSLQHQQQQLQQRSMLPELATVVADTEIAQEPQLLLVFGPALTLAGYPPYHTRAAEVQHMGSLAAGNRQAIETAIARYCKVLQRHGA